MCLKKYNKKFNLLLFIILINTKKNNNFQIKKILSQNYSPIIKAGLLIGGLYIAHKELKKYKNLDFVLEEHKIDNTVSAKLKFLYLKPFLKKIILSENFITKKIKKYIFNYTLNIFEKKYFMNEPYQKFNNVKASRKKQIFK